MKPNICKCGDYPLIKRLPSGGTHVCCRNDCGIAATAGTEEKAVENFNRRAQENRMSNTPDKEFVPNRHSARLEDALIDLVNEFSREFVITRAEVIGSLELTKQRYVNDLFRSEQEKSNE